MLTDLDLEERALAIAAARGRTDNLAVTAQDCGMVAAFFALFGTRIFTLRELMTEPFPRAIADRFAMVGPSLADPALLGHRLPGLGLLKVAPDQRSFALSGDGRKLAILLGVTSPQRLDEEL